MPVDCSDPKEGYVKINCNGSLVDFGTKAYCGGVVRDDTRISCLLSQLLLTLIPSLWLIELC
jgi:hypothetical protein